MENLDACTVDDLRKHYTTFHDLFCYCAAKLRQGVETKELDVARSCVRCGATTSEGKEITVETLDACTPDELGDYRHLFWLLSQYCEDKLDAQRFRARGVITLATVLEDTCEDIYNHLPPSFKW